MRDPLMTFGAAMRAEWMLDPTVAYLNHGTVGAPPRRVLAAQQAIRDEIERGPSQFLLREVFRFAGAQTNTPTRMRRAAADVAAFVGARGDDLVFVDNASTGANAVLRSMRFGAGDEILTTDHAYGAVARAAAFVAAERGAVVRLARAPYPDYSPKALIDAVADAIGPETRLAVFDHITSESALIFPVAELVALCHSRGVPVLVDGAHAPGALALDVPSLGADWYTANLHKWTHAPRSCGFLWVHPDRQRDVHPPVISWGSGNGFLAEFDWVGTRDPSPWLAAPAGIAFLNELGFEAQRRHNHDLAWSAATMLAARWGTKLGMTEDDVGTMVTLRVPASLGTTGEDAMRLRDALLFEDKIELQVHAGHGQIWVRISAQVYNTMDEYERLGEVVRTRAK
jgi:isopenicillin-N epimerase